jgi:bifunctional non-homologous end joining protein LigD
MSLKEYKAKRNFRRTREPTGTRRRPTTKRSRFVVQKHDATRLHYDFRLEMGGVLKSWAVPKGFPTTRGDRRLAVQVEDHPIDYAKFEGTIPEGNYGAGTVMVWDLGEYEVKGDSPLNALEAGKLHLTLRGKKLKGDWTLVRMRSRGNEKHAQWLLLKSGGDLLPFSKRADDQSAITRRSMARIASDRDAEWQSDRTANRAVAGQRVKTANRKSSVSGNGHAPARSASSAPAPRVDINLRRLPARSAAFVEPMKATLVDELPKGKDWIYEVKFDGVRAVGIQQGRNVKLISRNAKDFGAKYPEIVEALGELPSRQAILDGEIVALDPEGRSSFQLLQAHQLPGTSRPPIFYYVFDLIQLDEKDLTGVPLMKRKAMAQTLIAGRSDRIRFSPAIEADSARVLKKMQTLGLEGLIAKRRESTYEPGRRSPAWVKFKWTNEQEFVIGGYSEPRGSRTHFGAILVGYFHRGKLRFASKVGTGFDQSSLRILHDKFQKLVRRDCPFVNLPEKAGLHGRGLTASEMRRCTWVEPRLVCQIRFAEWTRDGHLRQPAFLGLREDKEPSEVAREHAR